MQSAFRDMLAHFAEQGLTIALFDESVRTSFHPLAERPTGMARHVRAYPAFYRLHRCRHDVFGKRPCLESGKTDRHLSDLGCNADLLRRDLPAEIAPRTAPALPPDGERQY